jgi:hypothetical protein
VPYLAGNEITITWVLAPTGSPLTAADYDIHVMPSNLAGTYTDSGIVNFVAPSASTAGSLQYIFTPLIWGEYRVVLSTGTGAAFTIVDEKNLYVFETISGIASVTNVYGLPRRPKFSSVPIDTREQADIGWREMQGVCEDKTNGNILVCGWREFADVNGTVQILNPKDETYTNYTTVPFTDVHDVSIDNNGRIYVVKGSASAGNEYEVFYSDSPYTSWTTCPKPTTAFAGVGSLFYDPHLRKLWWMTSTKTLCLDTNDATATFFEQQYLSDITASNQSCSSASGMRRFDIGGQSWLMWGGLTLGGGFAGQETWWATTVSSPTPTPYSGATIDHVLDAYGDLYSGQKISQFFQIPGGGRVIGWPVSGLLISSTSGSTWPTVTDLSAVPGMDVVSWYHGFNIEAFNKCIMYGQTAGAVPSYWESTDGLNWSKSTDTRFTGYKIQNDSDLSHQAVEELSNGGVAFISVISSFDHRVVYTY